MKIKDKCIHHNLLNPSFYHFYQVLIASSELIAFHELVYLLIFIYICYCLLFLWVFQNFQVFLVYWFRTMVLTLNWQFMFYILIRLFNFYIILLLKNFCQALFTPHRRLYLLWRIDEWGGWGVGGNRRGEGGKTVFGMQNE